MRVLVVEDDDPLRRQMVRGLTEAGYAVDQSANGPDGLALASSTDYDVLVLDLMLPGLDGLSLLKQLRDRPRETRVLILTARDALRDKVRGLDLGADDYLVKPFAFEELLARVRALVRRRYGRGETTVRVGDLEVDTAARVVRAAGEVVELTAREYSILEVLALRVGHVVTRDEIAEHIYDWARDVGSNVVDVYVGYLRRKFTEAGLPALIRTHRGLGYSLDGPR
jgi:two-component system OmpR family response regulator